jgi:hypothetical protein
MPSPRENSLILRRFDGVNLLVDQAYLGPSYLRAAQNWIPGETFRLQKTPGNAPFTPAGPVPGTAIVAKIIRVYSGASRYLYAVITPSDGGTDELWVSVDDGAWAQVPKAGGGFVVFASTGATYDIEELNGILYVGNGVDPMFSVPIGGSGTELSALVSFSDGSANPTTSTDGGSQILTGTYAYAWGIYDHTAGKWVERGQTREVTVSSTGDQAITFPTPTGFASNGGALNSQFRAHLFIAPVNLPIEFAHDHNTGGASAAGSVIVRVITADGPPIPLRGGTRTGRILRAHRGRLWIAGEAANPTAVWATSHVVPGWEQAIFNAGVFFPFNARLPRLHENVTSLGLASTGRDDPEAPLVITTLTSTWLFYGDILDDPAAAFFQVSRTVGCIERNTMVETPWGLFFVGLQSVYMIPLGGGAPIDVGWPIRPAILGIPPSARARCTALYHKGFYKLAVVPAGGTAATLQFWLDLRQGISQIPSWWGPSPRIAVTAWTTGQQDAAEADRGFAALDASVVVVGSNWDAGAWDTALWDGTLTGVIELIHQEGSASELGGGIRIVSTLQTGDLDDGKPFERKLFTRVRVTVFPSAETSLQVAVSTDEGVMSGWDAMSIPFTAGSDWDVGAWDSANWLQAVLISEGESVAPDERPRGRTGSVQLTHTEPSPLALRDFELRYKPVERPVRLLPDDPSS